jgi:lipopolysaccharide transport system permease protein
MINLVKDIWKFRFALLNLILKDFRIRYRNMSLGILWSIINPLVMLGVLIFIFTYVYPREGEQYFPIFVLLGLIAYNFLSLSVTVATSSVVDNAPLVKKVIFPRIILPLSVVFSQVIHFVIMCGLLVAFLIAFQVPWSLYMVWLPVVYAILLIAIIGLSLICSALNVYYRDVQYLVTSLLTVLFWFSPVFYSLTNAHQNMPKLMYGIYLLNPLAGCIDATRKAVLLQMHPDTVSLGIAAGVSVFLLVFGIALFQRIQGNFADRL